MSFRIQDTTGAQNVNPSRSDVFWSVKTPAGRDLTLDEFGYTFQESTLPFSIAFL